MRPIRAWIVFLFLGVDVLAQAQEHVISTFAGGAEHSPDGIITTIAGDGTTGYSGDGGFATRALFSGPIALAVDSAGNPVRGRWWGITQSGFCGRRGNVIACGPLKGEIAP